MLKAASSKSQRERVADPENPTGAEGTLELETETQTAGLRLSVCSSSMIEMKPRI